MTLSEFTIINDRFDELNVHVAARFDKVDRAVERIEKTLYTGNGVPALVPTQAQQGEELRQLREDVNSWKNVRGRVGVMLTLAAFTVGIIGAVAAELIKARLLK